MGTRILQEFLEYTKDIAEFACYFLVNALFSFAKRSFTSLTTTNLPYEESAQIGRVLWKRKWFEIDETSPRDFLTWRISVKHPDYILKPTVSLYAITKNEAVFVETSKETNIFRSDVHPFLYIAQFQHCEHVITMPIKSFHRLAKEIGDSSSPVIWLSNTGRCGSTILGQILESVPGTLLMSENDALTNLAYMRVEGVLSKEEHEECLDSTVKIICKPHPNTRRICLKTRTCGLVQMETISSQFPCIQQLFLYRNALETISSFLDFSVTGRLRYLLRLCADSDVISWVVPYFRNRYKFLAIKHENRYKEPRDMNTVEMITTMWASAVTLAKNITLRDKNFLPLKYEDLMDNPKTFCSRMFEVLGIPQSEVETAIAALKKDSQKGSVFGGRRVGKDPWRHFNNSNRIKANAVLIKYKLPLLGDDHSV